MTSRAAGDARKEARKEAELQAAVNEAIAVPCGETKGVLYRAIDAYVSRCEREARQKALLEVAEYFAAWPDVELHAGDLARVYRLRAQEALSSPTQEGSSNG